jgi:hypothetical protein
MVLAVPGVGHGKITHYFYINQLLNEWLMSRLEWPDVTVWSGVGKGAIFIIIQVGSRLRLSALSSVS